MITSTSMLAAAVSRPLAIQEKKRKKVKVTKGWVAVRVGLGEGKEGGSFKFMIPISHLYHPQFRKLLEEAQEVYGFCTDGPLSLPISLDEFIQLRWLVEREASKRGRLRINVLRFRSC